ncbi:hypothetical protein M011DRAFT_336728 [Sporormia fimetaria CBS 119925]|uniref:PAS domain-containing protein n=1 Tax=Sporormia fimetaria CBS 119925 TaxID=1340428 RepID=A0A6A6VDW9_9PLEO|nr:hypothetical protein M011DRAFT_336728 [Sporormia fimetaria CBS 119925]
MRDITFITIHDLSEDARILYSSDSIVDILGHTPDEVVNTSVWDWFHPDEVPFAKRKHQRGVELDKAAVLVYARIKNRQGDYVGCECCFSIVYDVMVCCTSIYQHGPGSQKRAEDAPRIRRMFASSPKDPRYHMLTHLSSKFKLPSEEQMHEPRAALFLNRFTRSLTVMYATSGIEEIIGISSANMKGRSFYYCIQENCLEDAVRVLESAKGNDSIAYLRFRFRDPRVDDPPEATSSDSDDEVMTDITGSEEEESDAGAAGGGGTSSSTHSSGSGLPANSSSDTGSGSALQGSAASGSSHSHAPPEQLELEAVISCTSDGLVVCLRRARPLIPVAEPPVMPTGYTGAIFAAPWAPQPVFQPALPQLPPFPLGAQHPAMGRMGPPAPVQEAFMRTIRDVGVFAWGLTGINGCLSEFAKGRPAGESQPPEFPVWAPEAPSVHQHSSGSSGYGSGTSSSSRGDSYGYGGSGL